MSTSPMRPLQKILAGEPTLAGLLDRRRRELALEQQVHLALPPALAGHVRVIAGVHPPELVLAAASGAAGALLRQRAPELLETLTKEGWEFSVIRVRVQARSAPAARANRITKQLDSLSGMRLRALAAALEDPGLSAAINRLASHAPIASERDQALERNEDQDAKQ